MEKTLEGFISHEDNNLLYPVFCLTHRQSAPFDPAEHRKLFLHAHSGFQEMDASFLFGKT